MCCVMIETSLRHEEKRPTAGVEGGIFPVDLFGVASALSKLQVEVHSLSKLENSELGDARCKCHFSANGSGDSHLAPEERQVLKVT